jgi:hypothetical protein
MADDVPDWNLLRRFTEGPALSDEGRAAALEVIDGMSELLGPDWLSKQYDRNGSVPGEVLQFAFHTAALPQFLAIFTRLRAAVGEPTFAPILAGLRRGVTLSDWRHALLQLEVGRAATAAGIGHSFEPEIPGSYSKADVSLEFADSRIIHVETTTLRKWQHDIDTDQYENQLQKALAAIAQRLSLNVLAELHGRLDGHETTEWLAQIAGAAEGVAATGASRLVESEAGWVKIQAEDPPPNTNLFNGIVRTGDSWLHLARVVRGKARQSAGPVPTWIRVDVLDGLFQFTPWAQLAGVERVATMAAALKSELVSAHHLQGVICSSGLAVSLGATDHLVQEYLDATEHGVALRRLLGSHLARETVIVPLKGEPSEMVKAWTQVYSMERSWLDEDLAAAGLPPITSWRPS